MIFEVANEIKEHMQQTLTVIFKETYLCNPTIEEETYPQKNKNKLTLPLATYFPRFDPPSHNYKALWTPLHEVPIEIILMKYNYIKSIQYSKQYRL